ncbi:hypothetical protein BC567DRAFT_212999 [Phyllosticta citribraziliensis]
MGTSRRTLKNNGGPKILPFTAAAELILVTSPLSLLTVMDEIANQLEASETSSPSWKSSPGPSSTQTSVSVEATPSSRRGQERRKSSAAAAASARVPKTPQKQRARCLTPIMVSPPPPSPPPAPSRKKRALVELDPSRLNAICNVRRRLFVDQPPHHKFNHAAFDHVVGGPSEKLAPTLSLSSAPSSVMPRAPLPSDSKTAGEASSLLPGVDCVQRRFGVDGGSSDGDAIDVSQSGQAEAAKYCGGCDGEVEKREEAEKRGEELVERKGEEEREKILSLHMCLFERVREAYACSSVPRLLLSSSPAVSRRLLLLPSAAFLSLL